MLTSVTQLPSTQVQMDTDEILSHSRLHKLATLIEEDGTCTVAEYIDLLVLRY